MKLRSILIRAYRSFNHDYRKKYDRSAQAEKKPWEMVENQWFPFIEIPIQDQITTIVGANESGKTHLINAVLVALGKTEEFTRLDRCRYLKSSNTKLYENLCIGLHWTLEERDQKPFEYLGIWPESPEALQEFWMFRDTQGYVLYRKNATGEYLKTRLSHELEVQLLALLPEIIELKSSLKLNKIVLLRDLLRYDTLSRIEQLLVGLRKAELLENRFLQRFQNIWKEQSLPDLLKWAIELLNSLKKELPFLLAEMSSSWKAQLQKCLEFLVKDHLLPPLDLKSSFKKTF